MRKMLVAQMAIMMVAAFAPSARAETAWSMISGGCTPIPQTIEDANYTIVGTSLQFKTGATGTISVYCPVSINTSVPNPNLLKVTYQDAAGTAQDAEVKTELIRMARSSGAITTIFTIDSDMDSNVNVHEDGHVFAHSFDFEANAYYVRINIQRDTGSSTVVKAYSVALED